MNTEKQLEKLQRVLELLDDSGYVKTEEFVQLFETLVKILKDQLVGTAKYVKENTDQGGSRISSMEKKCAEMEKLLEKYKKELFDRVENIELTPGEPGADADDEAIFQRLLSSLPQPPEYTEETPEETVNKVNQAKIKIQKSQVEGLDELERLVRINAENSVRTNKGFDPAIGVSQTDLARLQAQITEIANSTTTGGTWIREDVAGDIDGVNDTFTLSQAPSSPDSLILSLSRQIQIQGVDFTLSGATITYTTPPDAAFAAEPHIAQFQ